jgi:hypothetical protein
VTWSPTDRRQYRRRLGSGRIETGVETSDGFDRPVRLGSLEGTTEEEIQRAVELTHEDVFTSIGPDSFDPTVDDVEATLERLW